MAWQKGQPWRVVKSLDVLNQQLRTLAPRAVPPATLATAWGSIADDAHNSSSDHYPKFYSGLGATAVVCARDFPHAPGLGLDAHAVAESLRQSRDPRIRYIISNGRITGPAYGWAWTRYDGSDRHDTHIHVSSARDARADQTHPWQITATPRGDTMADVTLSWGETLSAYLSRIERIWVPAAQASVAAAADAKAARVAVEALATALKAGGGSLDTAAIIAKMDELAAAEMAEVLAAHEAAVANLSEAERAGLDGTP